MSEHHEVAGERRRLPTSLVYTLATVLVVGVLIGGLLLLARSQRSSSVAGSPSVPVSQKVIQGKTVTIVSSAGGQEMSVSLTPGPYFLSEMLAVDISLTNHTHTTDYVGPPFAFACGYRSGITITGGSRPDYAIPIGTEFSCPGLFRGTPLKPGQTVTIHRYLPLTSSGKQTLTADAIFYSSQGSYPPPSIVFSPLEKHWPTIQITVSPTIPSNRKISFSREGLQVVVNAPKGTSSSLVYLYGVGCDDFNDGGSTGFGNYGWEPISTNRVNEPGCPGKNVHWDFAFGTPGYGVAVGSYPSP